MNAHVDDHTSAHMNAGALPAGAMLVIPRLRVDQPIGEIPLMNRLWDTSALGTAVAHLDQTGYLADGQNTVIVGHSTLPDGSPGAFYHLPELQIGDWAWVVVGDTVLTFQVTRAFLVSPTDVRITDTIPGRTTLMLITCDSDLRLVVLLDRQS